MSTWTISVGAEFFACFLYAALASEDELQADIPAHVFEDVESADDAEGLHSNEPRKANPSGDRNSQA